LNKANHSLLSITLRAGLLGHHQESAHRFVNAIVVAADTGIVRVLITGKSGPADNFEGERPLTARQNEVMRGVLDGFTNEEIALNLKVSESSVKSAIQELFQKAGGRTRSQLVRIAIEKHAADWLRPRIQDQGIFEI
jgi:DNA-binding NarL/FixJ family response regulator